MTPSVSPAIKPRYWKVVRFGWGADQETFEKNTEAFLARYFPGRYRLSPGVPGLRIVATEEEIAFCEFDCDALFQEILGPRSY